ncbi:protein NDRG2 isoform X1 [Chionomys nivalis]|uniref:Protein NDRG2 n=1 Tax=Microtus ochrogaster TaxID=79684 RepID=A0ABM0LQZ4_MICOH|nr:protein NDRG2 isoform X1 [Microtus ochrogaster]XP_005371034.1 protein NDRG2 isoform X1 [Microtus ochrogaster]XP_038165864.1 protein NDRG2 isoform X1 [Arvicola amphibius]XP_038165867.1 protein NDRG2 isoform X1 [Arvicola amphibius]XP_038165868.1 protein NDRG2 isoform X1 [Arvicola amphibius]XP_049985423.1 protein NDRG2 isoform X1 [Microtus fortis]XP_049985425.1 protein NDRG2 isoform X1 [Microtus fortis]XP_049985426.1 protein NDRG2 isoform X1 [Microtus fortis]XP_049985427.1 protein NDRG2 iso
MAELQEVQITEEKPLLPGQTPETAKEAELAARILLDQGQTHSVETPYGSVTFTVYGTPKPKRPAIFTYHDVGLNYKSCFQPLFQFGDMQEIIQNFVRVHVDAPGMEEGAPVFPLGYQYPSLDQLADMIPCILQYLNFSTIIGVGVGAGAYILSRYALTHPDTVEGLVLINIDPNAKGWMDWAAHKLTGLTSSIPEMILGHLFSQEELSGNSELIQKYRNIITHAPNLENIELYWNSYNNRRDLNFERGGEMTLKCPVMLVVGDQAPHEDAVVECNSKLDPTQTSFLKMADSGGQPQLTQPGKLTEAFKYFLQGMGYMASSCMTRLSRSRTASLTSAASIDGSRSRSRTLSQSSESGTLPSAPPGHTMEVSC